jgi:hypothetical protein
MDNVLGQALLVEMQSLVWHLYRKSLNAVDVYKSTWQDNSVF